MAEYIAELIGKEFSLDGGAKNFRGPSGIVGIYLSQAEALEAARREANEQCTIRITLRGTRDNDPVVVYEGNEPPPSTHNQASSCTAPPSLTPGRLTL